ncbi:MAG: hypothetical protein AAF221_07910 [Pseudomonadota bacterium]
MALTELKKKFTSPAAAIGLSVAAAFAPMTGAQAQEPQIIPTATTSTPAPTTRAIDQVNMPVVDLRGVENSYGRGEVVAIGASGDFAVVKVHSDDQDVLNRIEDSLRGLVMTGYPRVGLVIAEGENGYDNTGELYLLASDGEPRGTFRNLDARSAEAMVNNEIRDIYPNIWRVDTQASLSATGPQSAYE